MSIDEVKQIIKESGIGYFATIEDGKPRVRPIMPGMFEDNTLLAATQKGTPKLQQLEKNNSFEICFIDSKLSQVRIRGEVSISDDIDKKGWLGNAVPMLRTYFPTDDDPNYVLLVLKPVKCLLIHIGEQSYTEVAL